MASMYLADDVLLQILVLLPVKSLVRFRCVSKTWCSLIRSSEFINMHFNYDRKESVIMKIVPEEEDGGEYVEAFLSFADPESLVSIESPKLPMLHATYNHDRLMFVGTCNGIICMMLDDRVILWNPALREFTLSCPRSCSAGRCVVEFGFGFDPCARVYKFVCIYGIRSFFWEDFVFRGERPFTSDLYDSSTNSWKELAADAWALQKSENILHSRCFVNGSCHWLAATLDENKSWIVFSILYLNMSTENFKVFGFPNCMGRAEEQEQICSLLVFNECLGVVQRRTWSNDPACIEVWVMEEYGMRESWTKKFVIEVHTAAQRFFCWDSEWLLFAENGELTCWSLLTNESKRFQFDRPNNRFKCLFYKESLIGVHEFGVKPKQNVTNVPRARCKRAQQEEVSGPKDNATDQTIIKSVPEQEDRLEEDKRSKGDKCQHCDWDS